MIFQESGLVENLELIIDPLNLIFWIIATAIFVINSYKKKEIKFFSISFFLMIIATALCFLEVELFEALFIMFAAIMALLASIFLRIKTVKREMR
ncbi:MAG: hypothetical protein ACFFAH_08190 [Promethearchaeota archaeon]